MAFKWTAAFGDDVVCPHCRGAERVFGGRVARRDLRRYERKGPSKTARLLIEGVADAAPGATLLDVGGGVGVLEHELVARGALRTTDVDASGAYLAVARAEAMRRGYADRAGHIQGDFVELALDVAPADLVMLDRVVCCYPDATRLLAEAAGHTRRRLGLAWPRDAWWTRAGSSLANVALRVSRSRFRTFVHPDALVHGTLERNGLKRRSLARVGFWQVAIYERAA